MKNLFRPTIGCCRHSFSFILQTFSQLYFSAKKVVFKNRFFSHSSDFSVCSFDCFWLEFSFLSSPGLHNPFFFFLLFLSSAATSWLVWPRTSKAESRRPHTASRGQANMFSFPQKYIFICSEIHLLFNTNPLMYYSSGGTAKRFVKLSILGMNFEIDRHTNTHWKPLICIKVRCIYSTMNDPPPHHPFFKMITNQSVSEMMRTSKIDLPKKGCQAKTKRPQPYLFFWGGGSRFHCYVLSYFSLLFVMEHNWQIHVTRVSWVGQSTRGG